MTIGTRSLRIAVTVLFAVLALNNAAVAQAAKPRPLEIYFVDVEGGAATLIVTPAGESVLVDTGWPREDSRDPQRIAAAARQAGIQRIDHLIITHFHRDHWGGVEKLAALLPVARFYDHGVMKELADDKTNFPTLNAAYTRASSGKSTALKPGDRITLVAARGAAPLDLRVIASNGETLAARGPANAACPAAQLQQDDPSDNARSVGFLLRFGEFRFLDLGDLTWNTEHKLACPSNAVGKVTLYQVTHHGANTSNNRALLASVQPKVAIMNNGPRKGGHPDTVKALRELKSLQALWQVHRNIDTGDADNVSPEFIANLGPEQDCQGHLIKVSVDPDGRKFTVLNTRTGKLVTYQ